MTMLREHMEDLAKLYAPAAALAIRNGQWDQAAALLLERCKKLDMALQSLTPGGSEYVGNPDLCVQRANERVEALHKLWRDAVAKQLADKSPLVLERKLP